MAISDTIYHTRGDPGTPFTAQDGRAALSGALLEVGWKRGKKLDSSPGAIPLDHGFSFYPSLCVLVNNGGADTLCLKPNTCKCPVSGSYYLASLCGDLKDSLNPASPTLNS